MLAGETRSDARMETSEGPRATGGEKPYEKIETRGLSYREDIKTRRALLPQEDSPTERIEI